MSKTKTKDTVRSGVTERLKSIGIPLYFNYRCLRADLAHRRTQEEYQCSSRTDAPEHVLIVVIDALRPDYRPQIGMEFTTAITPAPWTFPAVTSIHTGQYPHEHQAIAHTRAGDDEYAMPAQAAPDRHLPGAFESMGYATGCFSGFMMPLLAVEGWYQRHRAVQHGRAERVISAYREWRREKEKTFAYVHLSDLHEPLSAPQEYETDIDTSIPNLRTWDYTDDFGGSDECERYRDERLKLYEACLRYVSDCLDPFIKQVSDDTVVVVTGDHGEAHWEHYELDRQFTDSRPNYGVGHGGTPFDMVARVPLASSIPNDSTLNLGQGWPSLRDLPATALRTVADSSLFPGRAWQDSIPKDRWVICEGTRYGAERRAIYRGGTKVIHSMEDDVTLIAKVNRDKVEETFVDDHSAGSRELMDVLFDIWAEEKEDTANISTMVQKHLEALGYK